MPYVGERGNHLCFAQKHTENTSCILSTATARPSYALRLSTHGVTGAESRRRQKEISLEYLTEEKFYPLGTTDEYFEAPYEEYPITICGQTVIRSVITASPVNDELLSAVGKLTAEYGKIGGNLNQIARCLNEYGAPYNALSQEVRAATAEPAALKFEVLQKAGEAVGNIQTYQL